MSISEAEETFPQPFDPALTDVLRRFGYDVEPPRPGEASGRSIVARRDLGDRVVLLAIDAAGRFRVEITRVIAERAAEDAIAGAPVRLVETVTRALTISGTIARWRRMAEFLAEVDRLMTEERPPEPEPSPGRDSPR
jgi:hypothetical protein